MNVKSAINTVADWALDRVSPQNRSIKSEAGGDRDADGRRDQKEEPSKRLTQEDLQNLETIVQNLPGFKDSQLQASLQKSNEIYVLIIKSPDGKVVRRIPESEFPGLLQVSESSKGAILNKAL